MAIIRYVLVESRFGQFLRDTRYDAIAAPLVATYFATFTQWKDEWDFFKNSLKFHQYLYWSLLVLGGIWLCLRGISNWVFPPEKNHADVLETLLISVGRIISAKLKRFRSKCNSITKAGDTFELITQPREQVEVIIQEVMDFLKTWIGATLDQCDIVVFHKEQDEKWKYFASANPAWQRSDADSIFTKNSIAKFCVETGEYHFFPEKRLAAKTRLYHLSERDNRTDRGSVFCMPITNTFEGWSDHYLILLSTFGVRLCEPDDEKMVKVSKEILKEIFKRVELELLLNSIKLRRQQLKRTNL